MSFNLPFGVRVAGTDPIDADRYVVADIPARDLLITNARAGNGQQAWVLSEKKLYILEDASVPTWTEVGAGGGGGVPEAPNDGKQYGRQSEDWTEIGVGSGKYERAEYINAGTSQNILPSVNSLADYAFLRTRVFIHNNATGDTTEILECSLEFVLDATPIPVNQSFQTYKKYENLFQPQAGTNSSDKQYFQEMIMDMNQVQTFLTNFPGSSISGVWKQENSSFISNNVYHLIVEYFENYDQLF